MRPGSPENQPPMASSATGRPMMVVMTAATQIILARLAFLPFSRALSRRFVTMT